MDNPWGCGTSTGDGKKLCLCLFCIKAAGSGWAAGKNLGHPRRTGGRKMQERRRPCRQGGGAGHGASRRPRPTGIPAHRTGRPSVPPLQKCRDLSDERRRGRSQTGPRERHTPGWLLLPLRGNSPSAPPLRFQKTLLGLGRGGPWASRRDLHWARWLGKARRTNGTAPAEIFANPGPSGPAGIQTRHSDFARRKRR